MGQVLLVVEETIDRRGRLLLGVVNAAKVVNMRRDEALQQAVCKADLVLADGMAVVWASRLLGRRLPERVPGIDLMFRMLRRAHERGFRVYCLGATDEVLQTVVDRVRTDYPGVVLAGRHHGYFREQEGPQIAAAIRAARPDMLFVAMSSPKKEQFLARWNGELCVPVCHGVGGAFDVLAGKTRRAPLGWQRWGLEWFYRVLQEPRRMWRRYLVTNTLFGWLVLSELVARLRRGKTLQA